MQIKVLPEKIGVLGTLWEDKQQQKRRHCRNTILYPFPRHAKGKQVKGAGGDQYLQAMCWDEETLRLSATRTKKTFWIVSQHPEDV